MSIKVTKEKLIELLQEYRKWQLAHAKELKGGKDEVLMFDRIPTFMCADGFEISIQAGRSYFSMPQEDLAYWVELDVAIYTDKPEPHLRRTERQVCDSFTVYGYTKVEAVVRVINSHGGLRDTNNLKIKDREK